MAALRRSSKLISRYLNELDAKTSDNAEVKEAKRQLLEYLLQFDNSEHAPSYTAQLQAKLEVLNRIQFGASTGQELSDSLSKLQTGNTVQFKATSFGRKIIDGLLKLFGLQPATHFDDVIKAAKAEFKQSLGTLTYKSAAQASNGLAHLNGDKIAKCREEETTTTMNDFARSTSLDGKQYLQANPDQKYKDIMIARIQEFTGESGQDSKTGYTGEITHTAAQTLCVPMVNELMEQIPCLAGEYMVTAYKPDQLQWGKDGQGFYADISFKIIGLQQTETGKFFTANPDPSATSLHAISDDEASRLTKRKAGETKDNEALVLCSSRIRYSLAEGATRPTPSIEHFTLVNRYPEELKFSEQAQQHIETGLKTSVAHHQPGWLEHAGTHADESPPTQAHTQVGKPATEDEGAEQPHSHL